MAVRDFLNEGGKLINAGETGAGRRPARDHDVVGGLYYGLNGDPTRRVRDHHRRPGPLRRLPDPGQRLPPVLARRVHARRASAVRTCVTRHRRADRRAASADLERHADEPARRGGRRSSRPATCCRCRSSRSSASQGAAEYDFAGGPFAPVEGTRYAAGVHADDSYMRLTKTIDLPGDRGAARRSCGSSCRYEHRGRLRPRDRRGAHGRPGRLDDAAATSTAARRPTLPAECDGRASCSTSTRSCCTTSRRAPRCTATGTSGAWNSFTGSSGGWKDVAFDLSAYAGKQVEIVDLLRDRPGHAAASARSSTTRRSSIDGAATLSADGFEGATSTWTVQRRARGQPADRRQLGDRPAGGQLLRRHVDRATRSCWASASSRSTAPADRTKLIKPRAERTGVR